ncbi:AraC family transcriptional regulator [Clostridium rectalis]|uniref:AraC family transcriptional regulator n=1 Tax=Clostridium rectalis TaxID=2040295 RepID=UPI000F6439F8|nr:AraC family transcriptional regulator [Clostridium rectalis]
MENKSNISIRKELDIPNTFRRYNGYSKKGNYEFYCQEFAYSAIYGNLKLSNLSYILKLLKLNKPPEILFLVRVDDCNDIYNSFPRFSIYPQKVNVINRLEMCLEELAIKGVVASFLGRDTIGVFLCFSEDTITKIQLGKIAKYLINKVKKFTKESISIGISDFCKNINEFPRGYIQCQKAFENNFSKGRENYTFYDEVQEERILLCKEDMDSFAAKIIFYIDSVNFKGYIEEIQKMIKHISNTNTSSVDVRMQMVKLVDSISSFYIKEGIEKEKIDHISIVAMKEVLNSNFIGSIEKIIIEFCQEVMKNSIIIHQNIDEKMKLFIEECIKKYYKHSNFNLEKAARLCNYSPYYFGRRFKDIFGISFNKYLTNYRIDKSIELLKQSQLSLEDIAFQLGFCSVSYFCTVFKRVTGLSPRHYIKENL